jgi:Mn2+/Fe2+ NRAMP family transporter
VQLPNHSPPHQSAPPLILAAAQSTFPPAAAASSPHTWTTDALAGMVPSAQGTHPSGDVAVGDDVDNVDDDAVVTVQAHAGDEAASASPHQQSPAASPSQETVSRWRRSLRRNFFDFLRHSGPGWLMTVSMVDPGNLYADIISGSKFGYTQLWVTWWSHVAMICISWICARLVFCQLPARDFARCERAFYLRPKSARYVLWVIAEFLVVITDIPEVIGFAFGISILTGLPVWGGVLLSLVPTVIFLALETFGFRALEMLVIMLVNILLTFIVVSLGLSGADVSKVFRGWWQPSLSGGDSAIFAALGSIGSVVMPHNFYLLTAALVAHHFEAFGGGIEDGDESGSRIGAYDDELATAQGSAAGLEPESRPGGGEGDASEEVDMKTESYRGSKIKMFTLESILPVLFAFIVNLAMISITAKHAGPGVPAEPGLKADDLGLFNICEVFRFRGACKLWGVMLLASGQASVITTTITGNFVMKSFVDVKVNRFVRPLMTRGIAILPSLIVSAVSARESTVNTIIGIVNVTLAFLLPVVLIPMVRMNNARKKMHWIPLVLFYGFTFALVPFNLYNLTAPDNDMFGQYTGFISGENFRWAVQANIVQDVTVVSYIGLLFYLAVL